MTSSPSENKKPFISVIMPVRNEGNFIRRSLGAVLAQDYPHESMEVFVADGMSTDNTRAAIAEMAAANPVIKIRVVDNPGKIVPVGMNLAMAQANGEIIVRVDGHCEVAPDYVSKCVEHLLDDHVDGVGGPIDTVGENSLSQTIALAMSSPFGVGGSAFRTIKDKAMLVDTVAFPAYTRIAVNKVGPYDEELVRNQDDEYNYRLRSLGYKLLLSPDIHSRYYSRSSIRSLWRQYYQYGYWKVRVMQKHPRQMSLRQFIPPLFVAGLIGGAVLAILSPFVRALWIAAIVLYIVGNLMASIQVATRHGWQHLRWLPLAFATLHISYGAGFLVGLIKHINRWQSGQP